MRNTLNMYGNISFLHHPSPTCRRDSITRSLSGSADFPFTRFCSRGLPEGGVGVEGGTGVDGVISEGLGGVFLTALDLFFRFGLFFDFSTSSSVASGK